MREDKPVGLESSEDHDDMANKLRKQGYIVKKPVKYRKATFEIEVELGKEFNELTDELKDEGIKKKEAFNEAIGDWIRRVRQRRGKK